MGDLPANSGVIKWGSSLTWGYYAQDFHRQNSAGVSAFEWLMSFDAGEGQQGVRGLLGRMLFSGDEGDKLTDILSGGEASRLLMARLMQQKNAVLIFDEPTNHLDLESVNALGEGLSTFGGTAFVVTHDRDLVTDVATRILAFSNGSLIDFQGTYEEFLEVHPLQERLHHGHGS